MYSGSSNDQKSNQLFHFFIFCSFRSFLHLESSSHPYYGTIQYAHQGSGYTTVTPIINQGPPSTAFRKLKTIQPFSLRKELEEQPYCRPPTMNRTIFISSMSIPARIRE